MKLKILSLLGVLVSVVVLGNIGHADSAPLFTLGPLSFPLPWNNINAVYLYSVTEKVNQVGGESVIAQVKIGSAQSQPVNLDLTAGGVVNPTSNNLGTAFVGANLSLPATTMPFLQWIQPIQPGLFGGYDINQHLWEFGLKAALPIFRG